MTKTSSVLSNKRPVLMRKFRDLNTEDISKDVETPQDPNEAMKLGYTMGLKKGWGKGLAEGVDVGIDVGVEVAADVDAEASTEPFDTN